MGLDKILILGKGFIGNRLQEQFHCAISDRKILSYTDAEEEIKRFSPQIIINCIGHIGITVDECELDPDKTLMANAFVPIILGEAVFHLNKNIKLIHISSGCIYHYDYLKNKPIGETEDPDYFDLFYSRTKIYSEMALATLFRNKKQPFLIIRIRIPLDNRPEPRNILSKLIRYKKIIDIPNSITYIPDFIEALEHLIGIDAQGIYNIVNKGSLEYPELMAIYKKYVPSFNYEVIDYKELNLTRTNLILSTKKIQKSGFKMRDIHEVLEECVQNYIKY